MRGRAALNALAFAGVAASASRRGSLSAQQPRALDLKETRRSAEKADFMTSDARRAKIEHDLETAQAEFEQRLISKLRSCALGHWGLFGKNGEDWDEGKELVAQGQEISELRKHLGHTNSYALCERFIAYRRERGANAPGEPKLAKRFLQEIADQAESR
jgi:hypothetical protein